MNKKGCIAAGMGLLVLICVLLIALVVITAREGSEPPPKRLYDSKIIHQVKPKPVSSTWRFESVYKPKYIKYSSLALDSKGNPHIAYGGDQLYYAWFDGSTWHREIPDTNPGAGVSVHVVIDAKDQPHFIYGLGSINGMFLVHAYRNSTGWQHETIYADFSKKIISGAIFDPLGRLAVVYYHDQECTIPVSSECGAWYAQQSSDGWDISQVSPLARRPALAYDPLGQPFISYYHNDSVYAATRSADSWITEVIANKVYGLPQTIPFFDPAGTAHVITFYKGEDNTYLHNWRDSAGWHSEGILPSALVTEVFYTFKNDQEQMNLAYVRHDDSPQSGIYTARQGTDGWEQRYTPLFSQTRNNELMIQGLKIDQGGKFHLIYLDSKDNTLYYSVRKGEEWYPTIIDGYGRLEWIRSALAFDRNGRLASGVHSSDGYVHYLWKEEDTWQEERVGPATKSLTNFQIELLFDSQNRPNLLYVGSNSGELNDTDQVHAIRENDQWLPGSMSIQVAFYSTWSKPVISPEGTVVFLFRSYDREKSRPMLMYRVVAAWQNQILSNFNPSFWDYGAPQIAYSPLQIPISDTRNSVSLPAVVYTKANTLETAFLDPQKNLEEIVPILDKNQQVRHYGLDFDSLGHPVIIIDYYKRIALNETEPGGMLYVTQTSEGWQAYQLEDINSSDANAPFIDQQGQAHFTAGFNSFTYVTGSGENWKTTPIQAEGYNFKTGHYRLTGKALRKETGEYCVEVIDDIANSVLIGCLESIE